MKRRLLTSIAAAAVALGSAGVASANNDYWRREGLLLEVSADPRDGSDFVQVNPQHADQLQLVALNAPVDLRGMTIHFADGRSFYMRARGVLPGQPQMVALPRGCGVITNVQLDYIPAQWRQTDRTPARLQIIPQATFAAYQPWQRYERPSYESRSRRPSWNGYIEGRFRF
jgi:hypothetical protein